MTKIRIMEAHYVIIEGKLTKFEEVCVAQGGLTTVTEMDDKFNDRINETIERLKENPEVFSVNKLNVTNNITQITFSTSQFMHILEYYLALILD